MAGRARRRRLLDAGLLGLLWRRLSLECRLLGSPRRFLRRINYGFGYYGAGFVGGVWAGGSFRYNTAVWPVNRTSIHNTYYNKTIVNNYYNHSRVSYNGGRGGISARPTAADRSAYASRRYGATPEQVTHARYASQDRTLYAKTNGGRPPVTSTTHAYNANNRPAHYGTVSHGTRVTHYNATTHTATHYNGTTSTTHYNGTAHTATHYNGTTHATTHYNGTMHAQPHPAAAHPAAAHPPTSASHPGERRRRPQASEALSAHSLESTGPRSGSRLLILRSGALRVQRDAEHQASHLVVVCDARRDAIAFQIRAIRAPRPMREHHVDVARVAPANRRKISPDERNELATRVVVFLRRIEKEREPPGVHHGRILGTQTGDDCE